MKHSDISHSENTFGIHLSNKKFSITDNSMSINNCNSNAVMIGSVIQTPIHPSSTSILSTTLNSSRLNSGVKPSSASTPVINANMVGQLTYISPNNNTIKLVNLSKCQPLQNLNKESSNMINNNAINVQFVTPILNNTAISTNDCTGVSHSITKMDNSCVSKPTVVLTSVTSQSMSSNNSITCTRFILHSSQAPILPHGTVTIIPHHSEIGGNNLLNNQLIKNARYAITGSKQTPQAIRPITACTASNNPQTIGYPKQSISKISPVKSLNNYTINLPDNGKNTIATNRHALPLKDQQRSIPKPTPITPINYSSNNIRLALTSNIPHSKVSINPQKVQLISPKIRKRSGSPVNIMSDGKSKESLAALKDENSENPSIQNSLLGGYSPARKRARKQHLKGDNPKLQKPGPNTKFELVTMVTNTKHTTNDKSISTPISIAPIVAKVTHITSQVKPDDHTNLPNFVTSYNLNPQIIIPLKNPIHICASKTQALSSSTSSLFTNSSTFSNNFSQVQIVTQSSHGRPSIQLSPAGNHLIQSPTSGKSLTSFSPQKVIHIAPSKISTNPISNVKNEKISDSLNCVVKEVIENNKLTTPDKSPVKTEVTQIKLEKPDESNVKYNLFPYKYNWNPRRNHFEKECDIKFKRSKTSSNCKQSISESLKDNSSLDIDINDTSWRLCKVRNQLVMQKTFDEENLQYFLKLKQKFEVTPPITNDDDEPIFQKICISQHHYDQLPDQINTTSLTEFTDPTLFGISEDIIDSNCSMARTTKSVPPDIDSCAMDHLLHQCNDSCLFYLSQVPAASQPPQILRIIDLIEGLVVKETKIIEKESEINDKCLRLLESSEFASLSTNHNQTNKFKIFNERQW